MQTRVRIAAWLVLTLLAAPVSAGFENGPSFFGAQNPPFGIAVDALGNVWFTQPPHESIGELIAPAPHMDNLKAFDLSAHADAALHDALRITTGPDGNMWFTESDAGLIGRITPDGVLSEFPLPSLFESPNDITVGPDGNLWFTAGLNLESDNGTGVIGRITPSGTVSSFVVDFPPNFITTGPDGALWYTGAIEEVGPPDSTTPGVAAIGRLTPNGQSRSFTVGGGNAAGITAGPDGALWYARQEPPGIIGRITTDGEWNEFTDLQLDGLPQIIRRGPEDNLWFTTDTGSIWQINLAGTAEVAVSLTGDDFAADLAVGVDGGMWFSQLSGDLGRVGSLDFEFIDVPDGAPLGLAHGADDSIWFADAGGNRVGRIGRDGSFVQQELGGGHTPTAVAVGPDGSGWFTNQEADTIGRLTTEGDFTEFTIPSPPSNPQDIVLGSDGNFWFTEFDAGSIGRITPQGVIKRFPASPQGAGISNPQGIAAGPDGNLWFTDRGANMIGRMSTSGEVTEFPIPTAGSLPWGIAAGGDGNLYFTESAAGRAARITTQGVVTELGTPVPSSSPQYVTLGPDGAMWFTENGTNRLRRIARDGRLTAFELPDDDSGPSGIVGRSDGRLYFGLFNLSELGYTDLFAVEPTPPTEIPIPTPTQPPHTATPTEGGPSTTATPLRICVGECNGDSIVSIADLITAVNVALGSAPRSSCEQADPNDDGSVSISELIQAVNAALNGCIRG